MQHIAFREGVTSFETAILVKASALKKTDLLVNYVHPLSEMGVKPEDVVAFSLKHGDGGKASASLIKEYLGKLLLALQSLGVSTLYCTDSNYFKVLAGVSKAEPQIGYALPCRVKGFELFTVVLGLNYQQLIYNPSLQGKLELTLKTVASYMNGTYTPPGNGVIHRAQYPATLQDIAAALDSLMQYPKLSCDIEAFSLDFDKAGIGTISFAWDNHNGVAFAIDYAPLSVKSEKGFYGIRQDNQQVKELLRVFFEHYQGELRFHNANYDVKVLIYELWMKNLLDTEGMLKGLEILSRNLDDTKLITYLATNTTAGNVLSLKPNAQEFSGNYAAEEISNIRKIPLPDLLQYNLVDALSTNYVYDKYYSVMVQDRQEELYKGLFLDSLKLIIQMELVGMPLSKNRVAEVKSKLESALHGHLQIFENNKIIEALQELLTQTSWEKDYESRKAKAKNPDKIKPKNRDTYPQEVFNPNSGPQLQRLFYEVMGLPILDRTDTGQPAVGGDTIEKLLNHTRQVENKSILGALIGVAEASKILGTFIPAFERALQKDPGDIVWLHGWFNLGGAVSGRLSSNMQQIPAGNTGTETKQYYGKLIKSCFVAPEGWLFCGADFNSLEDYISALTTKDKNKLAVYEKGFEGHCLRAAYYFRDQLIHIDLDDPKSVNTIKKTHPVLRQDSKPATFLLTYGGTYHGLMNNLGWSESDARRIEANYHALYKESDAYVDRRLKQATKDGYVEVAFGLRLRTPLLSQVVWGSSGIPYEAKAEGRTAGNALGQSYGLLNNRAAVAFWKEVWASPYRYDVLPTALIHDAIYPLVRRRLDVVEFVNRALINAMRWQELPEIQHDVVKLGAALDIYWPSWADPITLPNDVDGATIDAHITKELEARLNKDH